MNDRTCPSCGAPTLARSEKPADKATALGYIRLARAALLRSGAARELDR